MSPTTSDHPAAPDLAAFALGKLDGPSAERVQAHITTCMACRTIAEHAPPDSLVNLLGRAGAPRTCTYAPTPSGQGAEVPTLAPGPADLPAALRDHSRYRILRLLGRGGMGVVYQAEHKVMERLVAVKVISHALVAKPDALERFHREVRAAAKLDHPNIVKAYDAEQAGDLQLLAMEYVEGKSLADVLNNRGPLPIANACHYVRQAALGLQHAFERGMVHRDLKPQNLMLTPKGVVKILDFGLAKLASESDRPGAELTQDNMVMGTPEYMAPEQALDSRTADVRADIYALGCTLYCLLTGRPPFGGDEPLAIMVAHAQDAPPAVESLRPDVPEPLAALLQRLLAKDPARRPQTPKILAKDLAPFTKPAKATIFNALPGTAAAEAPFADLVKGPVLQRVTRRRWWFLPTAVAAGLLLAAIGLSASGVVMVKTKSGTIVLTNLPEDAKVLVDGERITLTAGNGNTFAISVDAGRRRLQVSKDGFKMFGEEVEVVAGASQPVSVRLEPAADGKKGDPKRDEADASVPPPAARTPVVRQNAEDGIAKLRQVLLDHTWHYRDSLFPPGGEAFHFNADGTFHYWKWNYFVVGPRTVRVQYDRNNHNKETGGVLFKFDEDLTKFTGGWTDSRGVHKITGFRE